MVKFEYFNNLKKNVEFHERTNKDPTILKVDI